MKLLYLLRVYFATSQGKGVVYGIGGEGAEVRSLHCTECCRVCIHTRATSATVANIKAVQLTQQQIDSVNEKLNLWEDRTTADIPGIRSMHVGCYCT